jgi:hypothetical protein
MSPRDGAFGGLVLESHDNFGKKENNFNLSTVTLVTILKFIKAPKVIDYLSLDVEGGEWDIFKEFDFDLYRFLIMSIERPTHQLQIHLFRHGYVFLYMIANFGDCIFIHTTLPNFKNLMKTYQPITKFIWNDSMGNGSVVDLYHNRQKGRVKKTMKTTTLHDTPRHL